MVLAGGSSNPAEVDPSRLYVTGLSLGASGSWHLALRYGAWVQVQTQISFSTMC